MAPVWKLVASLAVFYVVEAACSAGASCPAQGTATSPSLIQKKHKKAKLTVRGSSGKNTTETAFVYMGCYMHEGSDRNETTFVDSKAATSINTCRDMAVFSENAYFAMEYPQASSAAGEAECHNFEAMPSMTRAEDSECKHEEFEGNPMGAANRLALYRSKAALLYVGCYKNESPDRDETTFVDGKAAKSIDTCHNMTVSSGNAYFAMEYPQGSSVDGEGECHNLNAVPSMTLAVDAECEQETFEGNRMGAANRLALYRSKAASVYVGCYKNEATDRDETTFVDGKAATSIGTCRDMTVSSGNAYFAMEYPQVSSVDYEAECHNLDALPSMTLGDDAECEHEVFEGNRMGAANRLALYRSSAAFAYVGCYKNEASDRDETTFVDGKAAKSINTCRDMTVSSGNAYFGMEYPQGSTVAGEAECHNLDAVPIMALAPDAECKEEVFQGHPMGAANRLALYRSTAS